MACTDPCSCCHGACCTGGVCSTGVNCYECEEGGGTWQGAGTTCSPDPCEITELCCCCDDGVDITCYTLDATGNIAYWEDCVTGVEDPVFGNLFGSECVSFTRTAGPCPEAPVDAFYCPDANDCCADEGLVAAGFYSGTGVTACCPDGWTYDDANLSCNPPGYEDPP